MSEKWNVEIKYDIGSNISESDASAAKAEFGRDSAIQLYDVTETAKTTFEKQCIQGANHALAEELKAMRVAPMVVAIGKFHIISPEEFTAKIPSRREAIGYTEAGHIYIPRTRDRVRMLGTICHELSHAASYNELWVGIRKDEKMGMMAYVDTRRAGPAFTQKPLSKMHDPETQDGENDPMNFTAFNEGVTEMFSLNLMDRVLQTKLITNPKEIQHAQQHLSYQPFVILIIELLKDLSEGRNMQYALLMGELFKNYITGDYSVMKKLSQKHKGAVKMLFEMRTYENALEMARALNLDRAVAGIEKALSQEK